MYGVRPGVVTIASKFDLFFVNTLGLPILSGLLCHMALIIVFFILAIKSTIDGSNLKKTAVLSFGAFFLSGIWLLSESVIFNLIMIVLLAVSVWFISGKNKVILNTALTIVMVIFVRIFFKRNCGDKGFCKSSPERK